jgi:polysaccharide export outer membrane protein
MMSSGNAHKHVLWAAAIVAASLGSGCAMAPGHHIGAHLGGIPVTPGSDEPPAGALTHISAELVRTLRATPEPNPAKELQPFLVNPGPYRIGAGDVLGIVVWGNPDFSAPTGTGTGKDGATISGFNVNASGNVQLPFIGAIKASGLTLEEFGKRITDALRTQMKSPQVTVDVRGYRSARIYVDGEVNKPGQLSIDDVPMTLPEALDRAGGLTKSADRSAIAIVRGTTSVRVNLDTLVGMGIDPNRIVLAKGDTLRVPGLEESRLYVLGEVATPGPKTMRRGKLSLSEALGDSGGVSVLTGNPKQVYVVRATDPTRPTIYHIDVSSPLFLALADGFDLKPRDVVYVDAVPLVRWNRVLNLVLPSATAVQTVNGASTLNSVRN